MGRVISLQPRGHGQGRCVSWAVRKDAVLGCKSTLTTALHVEVNAYKDSAGDCVRGSDKSQGVQPPPASPCAQSQHSQCRRPSGTPGTILHGKPILVIPRFGSPASLAPPVPSSELSSGRLSTWAKLSTESTLAGSRMMTWWPAEQEGFQLRPC